MMHSSFAGNAVGVGIEGPTMYTRRINGANRRWVSLIKQSMHLSGSLCQGRVSFRWLSCTNALGNRRPHGSSYLVDTFLSWGNGGGKHCASLTSASGTFWRRSQYRLYSSEGDGGNTSKDKHAPVKDGANFDSRNTHQETVKGELKHCDSHARLADQDQKEWMNNEKLSTESRNKEMPFLTRREKFKNEFLRRIVPWEKIQVSWETFPYHIDEHAKNTLVECATAHLKQEDAAASYGARLNSSSGRILLQSIPGSELYRERIVRALARDLKVPLLVLDSSILAPYDFGDDYTSECESDDSTESGEECASESEVEDESEATNEEEWTSSNANKSDCTDDDLDDVRARAEVALKKLVPFIEGFERRISGECDSSSKSSKPEVAQPSDSSNRPIKKGDRVKYKGPPKGEEANNRVVFGKIPTSDGLKNAYTVLRGRNLSTGVCGEVYEVLGDRVAVLFDIHRNGKASEGEREEKQTEQAAEVPVQWVHENEIEHLSNAEAEDCSIAMEVLSEVLDSAKPLIVYFSDLALWLSNAVPKSKRKDFIHKMQVMFDQLSGPVVLICGHHKVETGSKEKEGVTMILPGPLAKLVRSMLGRGPLPLPYKLFTERLKSLKRSDDELHKLFTNVLSIPPPKEDDLLRRFNKQIEEDRKIIISRSNLNELRKVIEENEMSCMELLNVNTNGLILTKRKAEQIVGWAKNHYLSSCPLPAIKGDRLLLPRESLEIAILRLKELETISRKQTQNLKNLAKDEYESNFVSAVVPPGEIGVKFHDIGALEDVKKALNELVILPMRRPELFLHGNLLRPCKGILLFGPPGTGKTLLAKALATEAGANFISITGSTLTSKWFGDAEKLTKALFSFASKLAPVIIFVDEVDSLLGARGGSFEHEATRRMRNEFMAAWDGLRSKDSQRILILGATNRPFDLDDAVIRRLPRRIYVDLPDAENRMKILRIILANENLEPNFPYEKLANATDGYSGSDLKNLCVAAAYRPVQELLEEENKVDKDDAVKSLRSLNLDDFIHSKAKVGPSVAYDAVSMNELRKWNEQYGEGGSRRKSPFGFGDK